MKTISSNETDPKKSNPSYCAWVKIKAGTVCEIYEELGREGGKIWSLNYNANGNLQECMSSIGRNWPNLYKAVRKAAPHSKLKSALTVKKNHIKLDLEAVEADLSCMKRKRRAKEKKASQLRLAMARLNRRKR